MKQMMQYEDYNKFAEDYCEEIVERIKKILERRGISQGTLAAKSGLGQSTVSKFLAGDTRVDVYKRQSLTLCIFFCAVGALLSAPGNQKRSFP